MSWPLHPALSGLTNPAEVLDSCGDDAPPPPAPDAARSGAGLVGGSGARTAGRAASGRVASASARDPRRAYRVVDDFESELAHYTGSPHAVAVDSATNAILLSLVYLRERCGSSFVRLPRRTYVGVLQSALNAGYRIKWSDDDWQQDYFLHPTCVLDSARRIAPGMYLPGTFTCLSFHSAKQLPLGRGGAILTDDDAAADWFRAARMDGRPPGAPISETVFPGWHCPMPPDVAARGLDVLSRWVDSDWCPPELPPTEYPDLSDLHP